MTSPGYQKLTQRGEVTDTEDDGEGCSDVSDDEDDDDDDDDDDEVSESEESEYEGSTSDCEGKIKLSIISITSRTLSRMKFSASFCHNFSDDYTGYSTVSNCSFH